MRTFIFTGSWEKRYRHWLEQRQEVWRQEDRNFKIKQETTTKTKNHDITDRSREISYYQVNLTRCKLLDQSELIHREKNQTYIVVFLYIMMNSLWFTLWWRLYFAVSPLFVFFFRFVGKPEKERGSYHNLQSSVFRSVDHFVSLNVAVGRIPGYSESGDGRVGHLHVVHSAQRHWERGNPR